MQTTTDEGMKMDEEKKGENGSDLSFEDSQEDEFEVEDIIQRADSDDECNDEWEDCDSGNESDPKFSKALKQTKNQKEQPDSAVAEETPKQS